MFLPLPATISGEIFLGANGTNHVCGSCDPSLCFILGHFDPNGTQSFTQTIPGKHCTDLGYDMGGFFMYSESGVVPPESSGHPAASPHWGRAKTRFVQQGWIADLAALTVVRELRFDPSVQQSLVSLPVAELTSLRGALPLANFSGRTLAAGQPALAMVNGSAATVADVEIDIKMPKGAVPFRLDVGALGAHIQLACSPASASQPVAGLTLFAPGRERGKTTRQSYTLSPGETTTSLRVLVDKVALEVFAGGGRSIATVATDKRGVDPSTAVISVGVSTGQADMDVRIWGMGCGWIADVQQQDVYVALKTDDDLQRRRCVITPGSLPLDTAGRPVHAHGAGVYSEGDTLYLLGTSQKRAVPADSRDPQSATVYLSDAINLYKTRRSSNGLCNWQFLGATTPTRPRARSCFR